ncbi:RNase adapter RapZ [Streptomyces sp. NPDC001728]|uniref:RapZ C-terminal domain-containing protein n=1 Tax=Streptomyces sp. NPDC001728 TaxID=3154396 RepID=UPI00331F63F8
MAADVVVVSFGYGHGAAPDATITLDLRHAFRDPHVDPRLRYMTAVDRPVRVAVLRTPGIRSLLKSSVAQVQAFRQGPSAGQIVVAVGCVGGRHRSATVAHYLARRLRRRGLQVDVHHRDLAKPVITR